jgi:general L-amino acid transport system permease protein
VFLQLPAATNSVALPGSIFLNQRGLFIPRPEVEASIAPWLAFVLGGAVLAIGARFAAARRPESEPTTRYIRLAGLAALVAMPAIGWLVVGEPIRFEPPVLDRFNFVGGVVLSPEYTALVLGLVIYTSAFIGEVVRGGIQAIRAGQREAAMALGLTGSQTLRLIVFPQALRIIVPPLTSQYLNLAKNSSLAVVIGYPELFNVSRTAASQTGQPISVIVIVMIAYLSLSLAISLVMNLYNRRIQIGSVA